MKINYIVLNYLLKLIHNVSEEIKCYLIWKTNFYQPPFQPWFCDVSFLGWLNLMSLTVSIKRQSMNIFTNELVATQKMKNEPCDQWKRSLNKMPDRVGRQEWHSPCQKWWGCCNASQYCLPSYICTLLATLPSPHICTHSPNAATTLCPETLVSRV